MNEYTFTNRLQRKANTLPIQESGLGTLGSQEDLAGNWTKKGANFYWFCKSSFSFFLFLGGWPLLPSFQNGRDEEHGDLTSRTITTSSGWLLFFNQSIFILSETQKLLVGRKQSKISPPIVASVITEMFFLNTRDSIFFIRASRSPCIVKLCML